MELGIPFEKIKALLTRKVYLIRHAPTAFNENDDVKIRSLVDLPLDQEGLLVANSLGISLRNSGIGCIYTSDLQRACQTSRAISLNCGASVEVMPELRAWNLGALAGKSSKTVQPIIDALLADPASLPPDSDESFSAFKTRTLEGLIKSLDYSGSLAIVTHHSNCLTILEEIGVSNPEIKPGQCIDITKYL